MFYTGAGLVFGITGKDVAKGEWKPVELPDPKAKVVYSACDFTGSYCHIVTDKGLVYFGGVNKKGESGEGRECIGWAWLEEVWALLASCSWYQTLLF